MRLISAALLAMALIIIAQPSYACPTGYVDCGRGLCCPR
jgi:hypothetical protein